MRSKPEHENVHGSSNVPCAGGGRGCEHPCCGCEHWYGAYVWGYCCNYIFDEGHMRPCEPGVECTARREAVNGEKGKRRGQELL